MVGARVTPTEEANDGKWSAQRGFHSSRALTTSKFELRTSERQTRHGLTAQHLQERKRERESKAMAKWLPHWTRLGPVWPSLAWLDTAAALPLRLAADWGAEMFLARPPGAAAYRRRLVGTAEPSEAAANSLGRPIGTGELNTARSVPF